MKTKALGMLAIAAMMAVSGAAGAATLVGNAAAPTAVTGLAVDGITYNVTFSTASYDSTFLESPAFLGNPTGAEAAESALQAFFNTASVTGLAAGYTCGTYLEEPLFWGSCYVLIPKAKSNLVSLAEFHNFGDGWAPTLLSTAVGAEQALGLKNGGYLEWAVFSRVPEPGSFVLLAFGLAALGLSRRRKA